VYFTRYEALTPNLTCVAQTRNVTSEALQHE